MALFDESVAVTPAAPTPAARRTRAGLWALTAALVVLLAITFLPSAFVIEQPGPVFDTLGTSRAASGSSVPLITVPADKAHPVDGALYMLTVQVVGTRAQTPNWVQVAGSWFDRTLSVTPLDAVFPPGQSVTESNEQSAAMMVDSQQEATAAALTHLGYSVTAMPTVHSVVSGAAAAGVLEAGDVITSVDGATVTSIDAVRARIADSHGAAMTVGIRRAGAEKDVTLTPRAVTAGGAKTWQIGVTLTTNYRFPFDVTIRLNDVGGPSAGMMFALGIIDRLTPESLTGGHRIAGTGTIDAAGTVGAIGGIRQKMVGARRAGAQYFLAPASNCDEVTGHVPAGLRVFSVKTLDDALTALGRIRTGKGLGQLPTCAS